MEIWKPISNFERLYEVSSYGRVRRVDSFVHSPRSATNARFCEGRVLKQDRKRNGYFAVVLRDGERSKTISVHRLVATAFLEKGENDTQVNHINCDKSDNRVENLEWCSAEENRSHAKANNLYAAPNKSAVKCLQTQQVFESSFKAAEWVNETCFKNAKQTKNIAAKIRGVCLGKCKIAYGFTWAKA